MGYQRRPSLVQRFMHPQLGAVRALRRAEAARSGKGPLSKARYALLRFRYAQVSRRIGMDVPLFVFGPGLSIAHPGTLIVNGHSRVGSCCRVHPGVTIGGDAHGAPVLGDNVFIGPNALIIGKVVVGDGAVIGPGALVTRDVPANGVAYGQRAQVDERNGQAWNHPSSRLGPTHVNQ
ncbi:hypothetical protein [Microbacterium sp. BH-3-3-3]|uniref:hypothetical protein n=1 Tax=Microbacterium sp. BH-3-3-3 TaxID=1906742 RepID=UPI0037C8D63C